MGLTVVDWSVLRSFLTFAHTTIIYKKGEIKMHSITDPQLAAALAVYEQAVPGGLNLGDIPAARQFLANLTAAIVAELPDIPGVVSSDHHAPGPDGAPEVMVRIYQPETRPETLPALLWIHGGGYVLGDVQGDEPKAKGMAPVALARICPITPPWTTATTS